MRDTLPSPASSGHRCNPTTALPERPPPRAAPAPTARGSRPLPALVPRQQVLQLLQYAVNHVRRQQRGEIERLRSELAAARAAAEELLAQPVKRPGLATVRQLQRDALRSAIERRELRTFGQSRVKDYLREVCGMGCSGDVAERLVEQMVREGRLRRDRRGRAHYPPPGEVQRGGQNGGEHDNG